MKIFVLALIGGLATGTIYGLVGLGYTVIFEGSGIFNFAQGQSMMVAIMVEWYLYVERGVSLPLAMVGAVVSSIVVSILVERIAVRPVRSKYGGRGSAALIGTLVTTLGASIVIQNVVIGIWGPDPYPFPGYLGQVDSGWHVFGVVISYEEVIVIASGLIILLGYSLFMRGTRWGLTLRAVAADHEAAALRGLPVMGSSILAFGIGGLIVGLSGLVIAPIVGADPSVGLTYGLAGFAAIAVGGFGSAPGALIGGLTVGVVEELVITYWTAQADFLVPLVVVLVVLSIRPEGLLMKGALREV